MAQDCPRCGLLCDEHLSSEDCLVALKSALRRARSDGIALGAMDEKHLVLTWLTSAADVSFQHMTETDHNVEHARTVHSAQAVAYGNAIRSIQRDEHRKPGAKER